MFQEHPEGVVIEGGTSDMQAECGKQRWVSAG